MRKALVAMAVVGAVAVAGCGGSDTSTPSTSSTTTQPSSASITTTTRTGSEQGQADGGGFDIKRPGEPQVAALKAVEAAVTSGDPAKACGRYVTQHYLRVAYGGHKGCVQAQAPGSAATSFRSYRVVHASHHPVRAPTVIVVPQGGPYDGERIRVSLVLGGPGYQVNALHANVPVGP